MSRYAYNVTQNPATPPVDITGVRVLRTWYDVARHLAMAIGNYNLPRNRATRSTPNCKRPVPDAGSSAIPETLTDGSTALGTRALPPRVGAAGPAHGAAVAVHRIYSERSISAPRS